MFTVDLAVILLCNYSKSTHDQSQMKTIRKPAAAAPVEISLSNESSS